MDYTKIGLKIMLERKTKGLTQGRLSAISSVGVNSIVKIERGKFINMNLVEKLMEALGIENNILENTNIEKKEEEFFKMNYINEFIKKEVDKKIENFKLEIKKIEQKEGVEEDIKEKRKKIATAKIQSSSTNVYINIPKLVRDMFNMVKGDEVEICVDTQTEEVTFKKIK